jgi:hypothetical protein
VFFGAGRDLETEPLNQREMKVRTLMNEELFGALKESKDRP